MLEDGLACKGGRTLATSWARRWKNRWHETIPPPQRAFQATGKVIAQQYFEDTTERLRHRGEGVNQRVLPKPQSLTPAVPESTGLSRPGPPPAADHAILKKAGTPRGDVQDTTKAGDIPQGR